MQNVLSTPITSLSGVGRRRASLLAKLDIRTVGDLLYHFPRAYENRGDVVPLSVAAEKPRADTKQAVILTVATMPQKALLKSRMTLVKFRAYDESGTAQICFFNADYVQKSFCVGQRFRFYGKVEAGGFGYSMSNPVFEPVNDGVPLPPLSPVYPLTSGITNNFIRDLITQALVCVSAMIEDPMPEEIIIRENMPTLGYALRTVHCPPDFASLQKAKERLAFDEMLTFALGMGMIGRARERYDAPVCRVGADDVRAFHNLLSYRLTGAQSRAIAAIRDNLASGIAMNRIVVGDVGCGKTVCAAAAMFIVMRSGHQAALMAPTGILAAQHAKELIPMFEKVGLKGALLVGSTTPAQKKKIYARLSSPDAKERLDFVIGTQALLSEGVTFAKPGLVITDEQHRFGVDQRAVLSEKNRHAHLLVMSATPIPRSLALVLNGGLDISKIDELPPGRQRVDTYVVDESYRSRLDAFIRKNVAAGGQVYVVCPAVSDEKDGGDRDADADDRFLIPIGCDFSKLGTAGLYESNEKAAPPLKAAVQYADELRQRLGDISVAFLHGKMKNAEKDEIMGQFSRGEISVLVSTTVIEVGVNVPNACLMIIENAERFGLSQLHQLRGRVGRGTRKSYCVLVRGGGGTAARDRLEVMRTTYDGYEIAEQDLAQRGPGDFLSTGEGIRQSGGFRLRLCDAVTDTDLYTRAFSYAQGMLSDDPALDKVPLLRDTILNSYKQTGDIMN